MSKSLFLKINAMIAMIANFLVLVAIGMVVAYGAPTPEPNYSLPVVETIVSAIVAFSGLLCGLRVWRG